MLKRILFVDHDRDITGSSVSLAYIIRACLRNNYEIYMLTPKIGENEKYFSDLGVNIINYGKGLFKSANLDIHYSYSINWFSVYGIFILIKNLVKFFYGLFLSCYFQLKVKPDILYINEHVLFHFSICSKFLNSISIIHIRSKFASNRHSYRSVLIGKLILNFNRYIFNITQIEADQFKSKDGKLSAKVIIVNEFLDSQNFSLKNNLIEIKNKYSIPANKYVILTLGGVLPIKGTLDLLTSISKLDDKQKFFLLVAGKLYKNSSKQNADYYDKCISILNSNLKNNSIVLGEISNSTELISCCNLLVSTSNLSHFSRPIIEAWAQKKSVIASDTEHSQNLIEDHFDGLLYENMNTFDLQNRIVEVMYNPTLNEKLGENGYRKAIRLFHEDNTTELIMKYLATINK